MNVVVDQWYGRIMLHSALANIICTTFERHCGVWQSKKEREHRVALLVTFRMYGTWLPELEKHTLRAAQLAVYAPMNYVGVAWREGPRVHPTSFVQTDPVTPWTKLSYHDSCWRSDGVERFLWDERDQIAYIDDMFSDDWYSVLTAPDDLIECITKRL